MEGLIVLAMLKSIFVGGFLLGLTFSPIGKAIAQRIRGRDAAVAGDPRVDDLVEDNVALRRELEAVQERLDFAERMIAQTRAAGALGAPRA